MPRVQQVAQSQRDPPLKRRLTVKIFLTRRLRNGMELGHMRPPGRIGTRLVHRHMAIQPYSQDDRIYTPPFPDKIPNRRTFLPEVGSSPIEKTNPFHPSPQRFKQPLVKIIPP